MRPKFQPARVVPKPVLLYGKYATGTILQQTKIPASVRHEHGQCGIISIIMTIIQQIYKNVFRNLCSAMAKVSLT
jgi:hypothetical protein